MSKFDVLNLSHGTERIGEYIEVEFEKEPVKGVRTRIAHPEAALLNVRSLGKSQIMNEYPGNLMGDSDQIAAAINTLWLGSDVNDEEVVVADIHCNKTPGNKYFSVGRRALKASMGTAYLLGYDKCFVDPNSFFDCVNNGIGIDAATIDETAERLEAKKIHQGLTQAALRTTRELIEIYNNSKMHYFQRIEVAIVPDTFDNVIVADDPRLLQQLEKIPPQPTFTEFQLDRKLRQAMGLGDEKLLVEGWNYDNMSVELPEKGVCNGRPRRAFIGILLREISPPTDDGNWVVFKDV